MKKYLFLSCGLLLLGCQHLLAQTPNCSQFKNGKYKLVDPKLGTVYVINRKGNIQTEYAIGKEDMEATFDVKWLDDCTYTLTPSDKTIKKMPNLSKQAIVKVRIIATTDSSYTQTSSSNFSEMESTLDMIRMK